MQPAREGQDEGHDVRADVVVVDLAEIGDDHRVGDQLRVVPAGGRRRLGRLKPAQARGRGQERAREGAVGAVGLGDGPRGLARVLRHDDGHLGDVEGETLRPLVRQLGLRRQHEKGGGGHRVSTLRDPAIVGQRAATAGYAILMIPGSTVVKRPATSGSWPATISFSAPASAWIVSNASSISGRLVMICTG